MSAEDREARGFVPLPGYEAAFDDATSDAGDASEVEALAEVLREAFMGPARDRIAYALAEGRAQKAVEAFLASDWLAAREAAARAEGAAQGLREAGEALRKAERDGYLWLDASEPRLRVPFESVARWLDERAARIAQGDS